MVLLNYMSEPRRLSQEIIKRAQEIFKVFQARCIMILCQLVVSEFVRSRRPHICSS